MLVVDASFLMAAFVEEAHTDFARSVLDEQAEIPRIAPGLVTWEFANILWKKQRKGEILDRHLDEARDFLSALDVETTTSLHVEDVVSLARLAGAKGLTAYDAAYLDLAIVRSAALATTDRDLAKAAVAAEIVVHSPFA